MGRVRVHSQRGSWDEGVGGLVTYDGRESDDDDDAVCGLVMIERLCPDGWW